MKILKNERLRLLIIGLTGGISAIVLFVAMIFVRQIAAGSPLCPNGLLPGLPPSCAFIGVLLPQLIIIGTIALLIFFVFRKYFHYSFLMGFFGVYYSWHLNNVISWLYDPLRIVSSTWVFYVLLFLLGSVLFCALYFFFVKLKLWLWLKITIATITVLILPFIILSIERRLVATFFF